MRSEQRAPEAYLRELEQQAQRLPWDERRELMDGMRARVSDLVAQGLDGPELDAAIASLGDPSRVIDDYLAVAGDPGLRPYRPRLVLGAVVLAWFSLLNGFLFDPHFGRGAQTYLETLALGQTVRTIACVLLLVLTIAAGMWSGWADRFVSLVTLLLAWWAPSLLLMAFLAAPFLGRVVPGWVAPVLFALAVAAVALATGYWARRLVRQPAGGPLDGTGRILVLGVAAFSAAIALGWVALNVSLLHRL